ncbi:MAG: hypothetical protein WCA46_26485, partial [Actinocatenispora sp.]
MGKAKSSVIAVVVIVVVMIGALVIGGASSLFGGDYDPSPTLNDEKELAADLAEATQRQGVCYGWSLEFSDYYSDHSISSSGSNQGAGHTLDTSKCRSWITFSASVTWESDSSESEDSASFDVTGSGDLADDVPSSDDMGNVGIDEDALIDDPYWTTESAMEALPLLLAQSGAATPMPVGSEPSGVAGVTPPPRAGSDLWRGHKSLIVIGVIGLVAAVVLLVGGVLSLRRNRRVAEARGDHKGGGGGPPRGAP